jgi:hypothetical protein
MTSARCSRMPGSTRVRWTITRRCVRRRHGGGWSQVSVRIMADRKEVGRRARHAGPCRACFPAPGAGGYESGGRHRWTAGSLLKDPPGALEDYGSPAMRSVSPLARPGPDGRWGVAPALPRRYGAGQQRWALDDWVTRGGASIPQEAWTMEEFRLDGKRASVTGASRGIGAAIAKVFAEAGPISASSGGIARGSNTPSRSWSGTGGSAS